MKMRHLFSSVLIVLVSLLASVAHAVDSTSINAAGALPTSNCPNLNDRWYSGGDIPNGYYKSNANGMCYPVPACGSGTAWDGGSQSCVSICRGGQFWNGSSCVCPTGNVWNGSSCGVPPYFTNFTVQPASVVVGSSYSVNWSVGGSPGASTSMNCSGANPAAYALYPETNGSGTLPAPKAGNTTCTASVSNPWGSSSASTGTLIAACPGGTVWNGSSCVVAVVPPQATLEGRTVYLNVNYQGGGAVTAFRLTGSASAINMTFYDGSSCNLTGPGSVCTIGASDEFGERYGDGLYWAEQHRAGVVAALNARSYVSNRYFAIHYMRLNGDGSLTVAVYGWTTSPQGSNTISESTLGTLTKAQLQNAANGTQFMLGDYYIAR
jgi:hypothetical protein